MTGSTEYAVALALFVASHFLPRLGGMREKLIGAVGRRTYFSLYGLVSVALLVWVIVAAGRAPYIELWPQLPWTRWVPNLAMPLAAILACWSLGMAQPFTLGGRRGAILDPDRPGLSALSRHPLFLALAIWAAAHLLANGDLAHVILFGSFLLMAVVAIPAFDGKARRALPRQTADRFFKRTSILSLAPLTDRSWLAANRRSLAYRSAVGLVLWLGALHLHSAVIGASPFPF